MLPGGRRVSLLSPDIAHLDGRALLQKAPVRAPELGPEIEFAASLMTPE